MNIPGYDEWLWKQCDDHMSSNDICPECGEEWSECGCEFCPYCKTFNGCSCDEQYQNWKDSQL